jgi:hypothetical protein
MPVPMNRLHHSALRKINLAGPAGQAVNGKSLVKFCKAYKAFAKSGKELKRRSISGWGKGVSGLVVVRKIVYMPAFRPKSISLSLLPTIMDRSRSMSGSSCLPGSHPGIWLPVGVFIIRAGAIIDRVHPSTGGFDLFFHPVVNIEEVIFTHPFFAHAPLVAHDKTFPNLLPTC